MGSKNSKRIKSIEESTKDRCVCKYNMTCIVDDEVHEYIGSNIPSNAKRIKCRSKVHNCICRIGYVNQYFMWNKRIYYRKYRWKNETEYHINELKMTCPEWYNHECICSLSQDQELCLARHSE
jgi:hypothetical protein